MSIKVCSRAVYSFLGVFAGNVMRPTMWPIYAPLDLNLDYLKEIIATAKHEKLVGNKIYVIPFKTNSSFASSPCELHTPHHYRVSTSLHNMLNQLSSQKSWKHDLSGANFPMVIYFGLWEMQFNDSLMSVMVPLLSNKYENP